MVAKIKFFYYLRTYIRILKKDNRLDRNMLKGKYGDRINAVLAACGLNLKKLYNVFLWQLFNTLKFLLYRIFYCRIYFFSNDHI
ncbi:MAG: hypothetical protein CR986_06485 [Ignavibacteriae bacterium]|nr:MAG: hypothetical protein CR986_06485 [Ignavibacteriota bacterium]